MGPADVIDFPREGPKVEDGEYGHFDAEEEGGDAYFDVGVRDAGEGLMAPEEVRKEMMI